MRADALLFGTFVPFEMHEHGFFQFLAGPMLFTYLNLNWAILLVLLALCVFERDRVREFLVVFAAVMLLALPGWFALPAVTPSEAYRTNKPHADIPADIAVEIALPIAHLNPEVGEFLDHIEPAESAPLQGIFFITSMPSLHVAWGMLAVWFGCQLSAKAAWLLVPWGILNAMGDGLHAATLCGRCRRGHDPRGHRRRPRPQPDCKRASIRIAAAQGIRNPGIFRKRHWPAWTRHAVIGAETPWPAADSALWTFSTISSRLLSNRGAAGAAWKSGACPLGAANDSSLSRHPHETHARRNRPVSARKSAATTGSITSRRRRRFPTPSTTGSWLGSKRSRPNILNWSRRTARRNASATGRSKGWPKSCIACRCSRSKTRTASTS